MKNKPFKVVVLYSAGHLGSALIINKMLSMPEIEVVGVVKAQPLPMTFKGRAKVRQHLNKVGWRFAWLLLWQRAIQAFGFAVTLIFPFLRRRLRPAWKIAAELNIPILKCQNINDDHALSFIKSCQPDLLVSAYFSQILKKPVIDTAPMGVLNVHPGWLPSYQGAMAYFWVLKNQSDRAGVTVHWIDEGIDTGEILARKSFLIKANATQETVLMTTAVMGASLLRRIFRRLHAGQAPHISPTAWVENEHAEKAAYYSMPGRKDFKGYFKQRRFFKIRNILGVLVFKKFR